MMWEKLSNLNDFEFEGKKAMRYRLINDVNSLLAMVMMMVLSLQCVLILLRHHPFQLKYFDSLSVRHFIIVLYQSISSLNILYPFHYVDNIKLIFDHNSALKMGRSPFNQQCLCKWYHTIRQSCGLCLSFTPCQCHTKYLNNVYYVWVREYQKSSL